VRRDRDRSACDSVALRNGLVSARVSARNRSRRHDTGRACRRARTPPGREECKRRARASRRDRGPCPKRRFAPGVNWPVAAFGLIGSSYLAGGRPAGGRPRRTAHLRRGPLGSRSSERSRSRGVMLPAAAKWTCLKTIAMHSSVAFVQRFSLRRRWTKSSGVQRLRSNTLEAVFSSLG
jgi:hypothetical protein